MDFQAIQEEIRNLSVEDQVRLMVELGPRLCRTMMQSPDGMQRMMSACEAMMQDPEMKKFMQPMMQRMMGRMMSGGSQNG